MKKYSTFAGLILFCILLTSANTAAAELITNGSFETGNFTGWTAVNGAGAWYTWQVVASGYSTGFNQPAAPQHGSFDAFHGVTGNAGATFTLMQQISVPAAQTATFTWRHRLQMDNATFCTGSGCGSATYAVEVLNTSNILLEQLYVFTIGPETIYNSGWQVFSRSLTAYAGQTIRLRFRTVVTVTLSGPGQLELDAISVQAPGLIPTAARVPISGRVTSPNGDGLGNIFVYLTGHDGETILAVTNPFGYFTLEGVEVGRTYMLLPSSKAYTFDPMTISVTDEITDLVIQAAGP